MLALFSSSPSLLVPSTALRTRAVRMADIGDTGVSFENVAREWRCKYTAGASGGPGDSASLKACQALLDEYLPKIKALPKASVTRQVCGGCLDFKVSITQPLDEHRALSKKKAHGREDRPACPSGGLAEGGRNSPQPGAPPGAGTRRASRPRPGSQLPVPG